MRTNTSPLFYECGILKFVDLIAYKLVRVQPFLNGRPFKNERTSGEC